MKSSKNSNQLTRRIRVIMSFIVIATMHASFVMAAEFIPNAQLPPLLEFQDGGIVKNEAEWPARRAEIRALMIDTFTGTFPEVVPIRSDTDERATGGIRRIWANHALLPKLGLFQGHEDIIEMIAPRSCLIVSPLRDRLSNTEAVMESVTKARTRLGAKDEYLILETPDGTNRFQRDQQDRVLAWLKDIQH